MILMIDNYDSFTYNLVQYFGEMEEEVKVFRNDEITIDEIYKKKPGKICISPGPKNPKFAGISKEVIKTFYKDIPILGICLGHQCIAEVFGGEVVQAEIIMHGKTSEIYHDSSPIFSEIESPFTATRYHSLIVKNDSLPTCLKKIAWTAKGEIMGIKHENYSLYGLQFHPESILSLEGKKMIKNFLKI